MFFKRYLSGVAGCRRHFDVNLVGHGLCLSDHLRAAPDRNACQSGVPERMSAAFNGLLNLGISFPIFFDISFLPMYSGAIDLALLLSWRSSARRLPHPPTPRRPVDKPKLRPSLRTPSGALLGVHFGFKCRCVCKLAEPERACKPIASRAMPPNIILIPTRSPSVQAELPGRSKIRMLARKMSMTPLMAIQAQRPEN